MKMDTLHRGTAQVFESPWSDATEHNSAVKLIDGLYQQFLTFLADTMSS